MGVPCADDVMLSYQSTSFHDGAAMRKLFGLTPAPEFLAWLESRGIFAGGQLAQVEQARHPLVAHLQGVLKDTTGGDANHEGAIAHRRAAQPAPRLAERGIAGAGGRCGRARPRGWSWAAPARRIAPPRSSSCARITRRRSTRCMRNWTSSATSAASLSSATVCSKSRRRPPTRPSILSSRELGRRFCPAARETIRARVAAGRRFAGRDRRRAVSARPWWRRCRRCCRC